MAGQFLPRGVSSISLNTFSSRLTCSGASRIAGQAQEAVAAKGAEIWNDAREKAREWSEEMGDRLDETTS